MSVGFRLAAAALLLSFFGCCVASAVLQMVAWGKHLRPGQGPTLRGIWDPDGYLDAIGVRQMNLARRLLIVGALAYVSHLLVLRAGLAVAGE